MNKYCLSLAFLLLLSILSCNNDDVESTANLYPESLIVFYPFNGNSLNEISPTNNGLVEGPEPASDINGSENSAYLFNGVDDVIKVYHSDELDLTNEFTISALVNPEEIKTQQIIRKGTAVNGAGTWPYGISLSATGDIIFTVTTQNGEMINQARKQGYATNEWFLVTGVFKDSKLLLYVNGQLEAEELVDGQITTNLEPLLIGSRLSLPSDTFKGKIDEVRIYNSTLTDAEVMELYYDF